MPAHLPQRTGSLGWAHTWVTWRRQAPASTVRLAFPRDVPEGKSVFVLKPTLLKNYFFMWVHEVFAVAHGIFDLHCGMRGF